MKFVIAAALIVPAFAAGYSVPAYAQGEAVEYWPRATSVDKTYSIETPCTTLEVEEQSAAPLVINGSVADVDSTVVCMVGDVLFSSGALSVDPAELEGTKLFDFVLDQLSATEMPDGVNVTQTSLSGKRVVLSREVMEGDVAQTGVIEMADHKLLLLVAGGATEDAETMIAMIERHANSLQVVP